MRTFEDLRSDQQSVVTELFENPRAYVVMRMGGGKTATCLTAISELIEEGYVRRAIVVAPPLVAATVWPQEPAKWEHLSHLKVIALTGGPKTRAQTLRTTDADVIAVSDGVVQWLVEYLEALPDDDPLLDLLAYDEPKLKSPRGSIGKALCKIAPRVGNIWKFSGTPRPNGYEDLFMPARILKPELWGSDFDLWRRRNFMPMDPKGYTWEVHDFRAKQLDEDLRSFIVQAPEPDDARHGTLTKGAEYDFEFELPAEAAKLYKRMERDLIVELVGHVGPDDPAFIVALSQAVASSKLSQIAQGFLYETPEDEDEERTVHAVHERKIEVLNYQLDALDAEPSVICYGFREDLRRVTELLDKRGASYGVLGHGRSMKQRMATVAAWNEGRLKHVVMHPASAGHGIELQFGGRRMLWYCLPWSAEQYDQTLKRLDRPGQTQQVYSHQIVARDTTDIIKRNRVEYKMADQQAFKALLRTLP